MGGFLRSTRKVGIPGGGEGPAGAQGLQKAQPIGGSRWPLLRGSKDMLSDHRVVHRSQNFGVLCKIDYL